METKRHSFLVRAAMTLLLTVFTTVTAWADTWPAYITDVVLAGGTETEAQSVKNSTAYSGYTWCSTSLNDGTSGDVIYIGYKKSSSPAYINGGYITDFIVIDAGTGTEGHNPPYSLTFQGRTYYRCPAAGGDYFVNSNHGNLTSQAANGWNMYLYYTKANFSDKRAVDGISIYSVGDINEHKSGAINCYYKNGTLHEEEISLNKGVSKTPYVYMHINTVTKTNRPSTDPVMASGLVYNGSEQMLVASMGTTYDNTYKMWFREIGQNQYFYENTAQFTKATNAGTYNVEYYAGSSTYGDKSETKIHQVTIAKSPNNGVTVSCSNYLEGTAPVPSLVGNNLSKGTITYKYSTSQNGTYTTTVPSEPGTHWVKATIAGDGNCYAYTTAPVSFTITYDWALHNSGDTEADAYVISTTSDLNLLAQRVNGGNSYSGKCFRLGGNITYSHTSVWNSTTSTENNYTPIGNNNENKFKGNFDGKGFTISGIRISASNYYNGLFGNLDGATVKNVILSDARIMSTAQYCGGIAGYCSSSTITNCWVKSNVCVGKNNYVGGIVGEIVTGTIMGCRSEAMLKDDSNNRERYGGIAGTVQGQANVKHCIVVGASVPNTNYHGAIVGRWIGNNTNNYYINCTVAGVADATNVGSEGSDRNGARRAIAINTADGVTVTPSGTATTYDVSGITAYEGNNGILYGDTFYAGATETVSLDIAYDIESFSLTGYTDGNGNTLTHVSDNTYTLTMTADAPTVTPVGSDLWGVALSDCDGTAEHPYLITTPAGLDLLASKVNGGTNYNGKYFELGADITYDGTTNNYTPIGTENAQDNAFTGHFDGKGHTVSGINVDTYAQWYKGLFGRIGSTAEVKNVTLSDATITGYQYTGGIVGYNNGGTVENCHVLSTVTVLGTKASAVYHGGIVGSNGGTVRGCTSAATVSYQSATYNMGYYGSIVGYNSGTIEDCLVYGGFVRGTYRVGVVVGYNSGTLTNNHYSGVTLNGSEPLLNAGVGDGSQDGTCYICAVIPYEGVTLSIPSVSATTEYPYDGLKIYPSGMTYKGQYYNYIENTDAGISGDVTFTATYSGSVPEDYAHSGFGYTSNASSTDVPTDWAATDGSATCTLCTNVAMKYYIAPTFRLAVWGTGDGTQGNPYVITTVRGMNELASKVNSGEGDLGGKYFELGADIEYDYTGLGENESNYTAIGTGSGKYFKGKFDGKGHTVSGIRIYMDGTNNQGLFGKITEYAEVKNVTLSDARITGQHYVGGIVGWNSYGTIENCHVLSAVTIGGTVYPGGITGYNEGTVRGCTSAATVSGTTIVGGIAGSTDGTVEDCLVLGGSSSGTTRYGVVVGFNSGTLTNNYHTIYGMGAVEGSDQDGARFAVATGTKPGTFGDATATYGTGTYTGITAYGSNGLEYGGKYYWHDEDIVELADRNEDNSSVIVANEGQTCNVVLKDRTLYKDGSWNTLRLPFDVDLTDPDGPLYGATYRTVTSASIEGTTLNLTFAEKQRDWYADNTLTAGTPYIIKWDKAADYVDDDAHNIVNPVFVGVVPNNVGDDHWNDDQSVGFLGTYDARPDITTHNPGYDVLLMGTDNTLHYAGSGEMLGALRAYFLVDPTKVTNARLTDYVFDLGNGETLSGTFPLAIQLGDANGDGMVTISDAVAIVNYILGKPLPAGFNEAAADMNGDGKVTITDAVRVVNMIAAQQ